QPVPVIVPLGPAAICAGASTALSVSKNFTTYKWSTGETAQTITVRTPGIYRVVVTNDGGCTGASQDFTVSANPTPQPIIRALAPTALCSGDSVSLRASDRFTRYVWSTGDTTQEIRVGAAGTFSV